MADWSLPQLSDLKVDVLSMLKGREVDAYTLAENAINPPIGAIRWNRTLNMFQSFDGTTWHDLIIAVVGGGTGGSNIDEVLDSLNLGTMSTQNSNAVNITGGSITGVSPLSTTGNLTVAGVITAGSGPTTITDSSGHINQSAIAGLANIAHINENETISGAWGFLQPVNFAQNIRIAPDATSAGLSRISFSDAANSTLPAYIQAYEPGVSASNFIIGNNYYGINGGSSGRRNTALGGSYIRLSQGIIELIGIDTAGTQYTYLSTQPSYVTAMQPNFQVGNSATTATLQLLSNNLSYVQFMTGGAATGTFGHSGGATYYDSNTHNWRSSNGSVAYGGIDTTGKLFAYGLQTNNNYIYDAGANPVIYISNATTNFTSEAFNFNSSGGATGLFQITPTRVYATRYLQVLGGVSADAGNATNAAFRFITTSNSGIYYVEGTCVAFGTQFDIAAQRAMMRCHVNVGGKIDFVVGPYFPMQINPTTIYLGTSGFHTDTVHYGNMWPASNSTYQSGTSSIAWGWVHSVNFVQTSDIRRKDIHGLVPDSLDLLDEIDPLIASFKEGFRPRRRENVEAEFYKFPTFSAQQIAEKLDAKYGTRVVEHDEESDSWGIDYGKLVPVLWQMLRELKARVKALEP